MLTKRFVVTIFPVAMMVLGAGVVSGQAYPTKPIRVLAGSAGSASDLTARIIAQGISGPLGQPVIVENRVAILIPEIVAKAPPDGYLLFISGSAVWIRTLLEKLNYDPLNDFAPITLATGSPDMLVVHPSLPVKSVKELIALAKARPGELNYSMSGIGGSQHLESELFKSLAKVNIVGVGYKGGDLAITAVIGGEVQMSFVGLSVVAPYVKSGKLRALAVSSAQPSARYPGLPTVAASLPFFEPAFVFAIFAPAKTPATIISRLNQEMVRVLNQADVKEKLSNAGVDIIGSSPEQVTTVIKSDMARMGKVIKDAGIKVE